MSCSMYQNLYTLQFIQFDTFFKSHILVFPNIFASINTDYSSLLMNRLFGAKEFKIWNCVEFSKPIVIQNPKLL